MTGKRNASAKKKTALSEFAPIPEFPTVSMARNGALGVFAVKLKSGELCVFSPVRGLTADGVESLSRLGPVRFLFAPNHYHNLGLKEYVEAFPDARLIASTFARERLEKVTGLSFDPLDALAKDLPKGAALLEPEGLKTGETWMRLQHGDAIAWIVVDAFCGKPVSPTNPGSPKTFPKYGLKDKALYLSWLEKQVRRDKPTVLIPCHGDVVQDTALPEALLSIAAKF